MHRNIKSVQNLSYVSACLRPADVVRYGDRLGGVKGVRQHGVSQEEHVLQHAIKDRQEACWSRSAQGKSDNRTADKVLVLRELLSTILLIDYQHACNI